MPNKSPSQEHHLLQLTERERELERDTWTVQVGNYKELGEAIATFSKRYDAYEFVGTAELSIEDGMALLKIELASDTTEMFRCVDCGLVPERPTTDNPMLCISCMKKVCSQCIRKHKMQHRNPARTIGGQVLCTERVPCGREGCPKCRGIPF